MTPSQLRARLDGLMAQVPRLFSDTLANNIPFGRRVPGRDLMLGTRRVVLEDDTDRLERGYDTMMAERCVTLSGGQMRRSAAARLLVTGCQLMEVDDLSSALEVETGAGSSSPDLPSQSGRWMRCWSVGVDA